MASILRALALFALTFCIACGDDATPATPDAGPEPADAGVLPAITFSFALPAADDAPIPIAGIPFPNDILKDDSGQIVINAASLPFDPDADPVAVENIARAFSERDCFGVTSGVWFPVTGAGDWQVRPTQEQISLIALPSGDEVPIDIHYLEFEDILYIRPQRGVLLDQGATYAVTIDAGTLAWDITVPNPVRENPALTALLSSTGPSGRAAAFAPLRDYMTREGIAPTDLVGATVFTTCDYGADFLAVRDQLDARPPAAAEVTHVYTADGGTDTLDAFCGTPADNTFPGSDNAGGMAHSAISHIILGTFPAPSYLSATPNQLGTWSHDENGVPVVKGDVDIPFLLALPDTDSYADLPVVIFQHGLNNSRQAVLYVANTLAAQGFAVIGMDLPFHGNRYPVQKDTYHNFTREDGADGLADPAAVGPSFYFFDIEGDAEAGIARLDPHVMADSLRQAVVDVMSLTRFIKSGDFSAVAAADAELAALSFDVDRLVWSSESFGSIVGTTAVAFDPNIGAGFLAVGGGGIVTELLENSPSYSVFMLLITDAFATPTLSVEDPAHTRYAYGMLQMLLEPGDPLTHAPRLAENQAHVVMAAAYSDESVSNQSSEALAAAAGLSWAEVPGSAEAPRYVDPALLPTVAAPVAGNHPLPGGSALTFAFFEIDPATHGMLTRAQDDRNYVPGFPPFEKLDPPVDIDNPIVTLQGWLASYAETYYATGTPTLAPIQ